MEVIQTSADGLKREFKVVVDSQEIESRIVGRLDELRKTVNIPGFRPGKVPASLLRKRYGATLRGEILEQAVNQTSSQALAEQNVRPAMQPRIEITKFEEGANLEYTMAVELLPDVVPGDFSTIKLTRLSVDIAESEVDASLERLVASEKNFVAVEKPRKAEKGDALVIDFVGSVDGAEFDGGTASDHLLELGSSSFVEGFEDQLIGVKPGDHVSVKLRFPENYMNDELAGKDAVFEVDIKEIRESMPATLDEGFAKNHGFGDFDEMRASIRERIGEGYANVSRARLKRSLLDALSERYDFAVPEGMVDTEFDAIWQRLTEDREKNQIDPSDAGRSDDELRAEYRAISERRVRLGLLLSEVGRVNNVTVENDELNRAVMERARAFPGQENLVVSHYRESPEALGELRAPLFEEKVVDLILSQAAVTDKVVSVEELMRDPDIEQSSGAAPAKAKKPRKKAAAKGAAKKAAAKPAAAKKAPAKKTAAQKPTAQKPTTKAKSG